jgi:hypothetical protein
MRWLCLFLNCKWIWHFNIVDKGLVEWEHGVYQCHRCKTISIGNKWPHG